MNLPTELTFSQSSLQTFEDCPRRFQLQVIEKLRWPAIEAEPVAEAERLAQLGADFHRLVHRHLAGLDESALDEFAAHADPELQSWWRSYLRHRPAALTGAELFPEITLTAPLRGRRLSARFDVLARRPGGQFLIVDWKTSARKPSRAALERRIQTRVYLWMLAAAGSAYNHGQPVPPEAVTMLYWYPQFPDEPEEFTYSKALRARDEEFLSGLLAQIEQAAAAADFPQTERQQTCAACVYRSWCNRGTAVGPLSDLPDETESTFDASALDWEQIAEIQF